MAKKYRTKGTGSVTYDKERGKWVGSYVDPFTGKRDKKRFNTKEEADRFVAVNTADILNGDYVSGSVTFGDWMLEWLENYKKNIKDSTRDSYISRLAHLEYLFDKPLKNITPALMQAVFNRMEIAASTQRGVLSVANIIFNKAVKLGLLKINPAKFVELPKISKPVLDIMTPEEIDTIANYFMNRDDIKYYTMIRVLAGTGMRIGELTALKWTNVDIKKRTITVESTMRYRNSETGKQLTSPKSDNSYRDIAIGPKLMDIILRYRNSQRVLSIEGIVFPTRNGTSIIYRNFWEKWVAAFEATNTPYKKPHILRHTHVTILLGNNIPVTEVAKRVGDTPTTIMNNYAHAIPNKAEEIAEKADNMYGL